MPFNISTDHYDYMIVPAILASFTVCLHYFSSSCTSLLTCNALQTFVLLHQSACAGSAPTGNPTGPTKPPTPTSDLGGAIALGL